MERNELAKYYMRAIREEEKEHELFELKQRKKALKQSIKTVENYKESLESQLESVLDRIDYITLYY